jgi:hypothetical protein
VLHEKFASKLERLFIGMDLIASGGSIDLLEPSPDRAASTAIHAILGA